MLINDEILFYFFIKSSLKLQRKTLVFILADEHEQI